MDKRSKIALYGIGLVIVLMMIAEITKPKSINWRDSYSAADKIPLGCYVLFNELQSYSEEDILSSTQSLYDYLKKVPEHNTNLLLINNWISLDREESESIASYVKDGNSVFISANYFYGNILDSLNVSMERKTGTLFKESSESKFVNPRLQSNNREFADVIENSYFTSIDTLNTSVLGTVTL